MPRSFPFARLCSLFPCPCYPVFRTRSGVNVSSDVSDHLIFGNYIPVDPRMSWQKNVICYDLSLISSSPLFTLPIVQILRLPLVTVRCPPLQAAPLNTACIHSQTSSSDDSLSENRIARGSVCGGDPQAWQHNGGQVRRESGSGGRSSELSRITLQALSALKYQRVARKVRPAGVSRPRVRNLKVEGEISWHKIVGPGFGDDGPIQI